jgi:hypothetical protein
MGGRDIFRVGFNVMDVTVNPVWSAKHPFNAFVKDKEALGFVLIASVRIALEYY